MVNVLVKRIVVVTTEADSPVPMVIVKVDSSTVVLTATSSLDVTVVVGTAQSDQVISEVISVVLEVQHHQRGKYASGGHGRCPVSPCLGTGGCS